MEPSVGHSGGGRCRACARAVLPYALAALFTAGVGAAAVRHEMWRDEMQAWLIARDSAGPLALLHNLKYEGHPGLWHLLLWPLARLSSNPVWMQVVHVAIAGGSALLLFRFAPFPWLVKLLLMLGYYFAYEWGVIARNYGISVLVLFGFCALYAKRWLRFPILGALLFLLCHTSVHGGLIAGVLLLTLTIEFAVAFAAKHRDADRSLGRFLAGFAIAALGIVTSARQMQPPPDSGFAVEWNWKWDAPYARRVASTMVNAYLPVPPDRLNFWNANCFAERPPAGSRRFYVPPENFGRFTWIVLAAGSVFFLKRPWLIVPYWLGTFALIAFFYVKYFGSWRHHGMLWLLFVVLLWMSYGYRPWTLGRARADWLPSFWDRHRAWALLPLLAVHVWGAWVAIKVDWSQPFTQAKAAVEWLNAEFPDRAGLVFAGHDSPQCSAVVGYMELDRIFYADRQDFGSYVVWDRARWMKRGDRVLPRIARMMVREGKDAVVLLTDPSMAGESGTGLEFLKRFEGATVGDERYDVYTWPKEQAEKWLKKRRTAWERRTDEGERPLDE